MSDHRDRTYLFTDGPTQEIEPSRRWRRLLWPAVVALVLGGGGRSVAQVHPFEIRHFVAQDPTFWALKSQRDMAIDVPLAETFMIGAHNAHNSRRMGAKALPFFGPNQYWTMEELLDIGVRHLSVDMFYEPLWRTRIQTPFGLTFTITEGCHEWDWTGRPCGLYFAHGNEPDKSWRFSGLVRAIPAMYDVWRFVHSPQNRNEVIILDFEDNTGLRGRATCQEQPGAFCTFFPPDPRAYGRAREDWDFLMRTMFDSNGPWRHPEFLAYPYERGGRNYLTWNHSFSMLDASANWRFDPDNPARGGDSCLDPTPGLTWYERARTCGDMIYRPSDRVANEGEWHTRREMAEMNKRVVLIVDSDLATKSAESTACSRCPEHEVFYFDAACYDNPSGPTCAERFHYNDIAFRTGHSLHFGTAAYPGTQLHFTPDQYSGERRCEGGFFDKLYCTDDSDCSGGLCQHRFWGVAEWESIYANRRELTLLQGDSLIFDTDICWRWFGKRCLDRLMGEDVRLECKKDGKPGTKKLFNSETDIHDEVQCRDVIDSSAGRRYWLTEQDGRYVKATIDNGARTNSGTDRIRRPDLLVAHNINVISMDWILFDEGLFDRYEFFQPECGRGFLWHDCFEEMVGVLIRDVNGSSIPGNDQHFLDSIPNDRQPFQDEVYDLPDAPHLRAQRLREMVWSWVLSDAGPMRSAFRDLRPGDGTGAAQQAFFARRGIGYGNTPLHPWLGDASRLNGLDYVKADWPTTRWISTNDEGNAYGYPEPHPTTAPLRRYALRSVDNPRLWRVSETRGRFSEAANVLAGELQELEHETGQRWYFSAPINGREQLDLHLTAQRDWVQEEFFINVHDKDQDGNWTVVHRYDPADLTMDGTVDAEDLKTFLGDLRRRPDRAARLDLNGDGSADCDDVGSFATIWQQGDPDPSQSRERPAGKRRSRGEPSPEDESSAQRSGASRGRSRPRITPADCRRMLDSPRHPAPRTADRPRSRS